MAKNEIRIYTVFDSSGAATGVKLTQNEFDKLDKATQSTGKSFDKVGSSLTKVGVGGLAVAGALGVGLYKTGQAASDLNESINAVQVTFKGASKGVLELGTNAAKSMGLSNTAFNGLAVQFSAFTQTIAGKGGDVVNTLKDLTGRAADFASVMNIDVAESARLFQSGLAGETEPLRKFGIDLSAASVSAFAAANGIGTVGKELTESEKVQARYASLMAQTSKVQGDFANTAGSAANATRIAKAEFDNAAASLGKSVTPVMAAAAGVVSSLAGKFTALNESSGGWVAKGAGIVAVTAGVGGGLLYVAGSALKMYDNFVKVKGALTGVDGQLTATGKAASLAGTAILGMAAAYAAVQVSDKLTTDSERKSNAMKQLASDLGAVSKQGKDSKAVLEALTHASFELEQSKSGMSKFTDVFLNGNAHQADLQLQAIKETIDAITAVSPEMGKQISGALQEYKQAADLGDVATRKWLDSIGLTDKEIDAITAKIKWGASAQTALATATGTTTDSLAEQSKATFDLAGYSDRLAAAYKAQEDALHSMNDALSSSTDKALASQEADLSAADAVDTYTKSLKDSKLSVNEHKQAFIDVQQSVNAAADTYADYVVNQVKGTGQVISADVEARIRHQAQIDKLGELANTVKPGSDLWNAIQAYIDHLKAIPTSITTRTSVVVPGVGGPTVVRNAEGGRLAAGQVSVVGEKGPELFVSGTSGTIIPNGQFRAGSGGGTVNVYITANVPLGASKGAVGQEILEALSANERQGGGLKRLLGIS